MELPAALVAVLGRELGRSPVAVTAAAGVYASDVAGVVVLDDGEEVFVKASRDPERRHDHETEARIGAVWTIDGRRGCLAAPWVDLVMFLVSAQADGHDAAALLAASPSSAGVDGPVVDAHLAALAGYWTEARHRAAPTGTRRSGTTIDDRWRGRGFITDRTVAWSREHFSGLDVVDVGGPAGHFLPEDRPWQVAEALVSWAAQLP